MQITPLTTVHLILWRVFLVWTAVAFVVMPLGLGPSWIAAHVPGETLQNAANFINNIGDAVWITLAALCVYFSLVRAVGLTSARLTAAIIIIVSGAIEVNGVLTDFPFGPYSYTDRFGVRLLGVLPYTIPLAWLIIIVAARCIVWKTLPMLGRVTHGLLVGFIALLTDINLEFIAWKVRGYWIWWPYPHESHPYPPLQNYLSWFFIAFVLARVLPSPRNMSYLYPVPIEPIIILAVMNALFLVIHLSRWLGWQ